MNSDALLLGTCETNMAARSGKLLGEHSVSYTPGNRVFSLIPDLWIHGVSLNDFTEKKGDSELSKSLVARVYRRKFLQIAIEGQRKKWDPPLSCVILYGFFSCL